MSTDSIAQNDDANEQGWTPHAWAVGSQRRTRGRDHNLSNGVQLGATSWYVKASDRFAAARAAIAKAEARNG